MGVWTSGTDYKKDDIVKNSVSTYIATVDHTAGADFFIDLNTNNYWDEFVAGAISAQTRQVTRVSIYKHQTEQHTVGSLLVKMTKYFMYQKIQPVVLMM